MVNFSHYDSEVMMAEVKCDVCKIHSAIGFIQRYYKDTGKIIEDSIGPNVCEDCAITLCDDDDVTEIK